MTVVLEYVATAPTPQITWPVKTAATITNVRYVWSGYCGWCRQAIDAWADGGQVRAGIRQTKTRAQWFVDDEPPTAPEPPKTCPHCGQQSEHGVCRFNRLPLWTAQAHQALGKVWERLRKEQPDLAARADRETRPGSTWRTLAGGIWVPRD